MKREGLSTEVQDWQSRIVKEEGYDSNYNPLGLQVTPMRTNTRNGIHVLRLHYTLHPKVTDEWIKAEKKLMSGPRWDRDMEIKYNALGGRLIFEEYNERVHVIKAFRIPDDWSRIRCIDYGHRNPTCCIWIALDYDGNAYVYREWYHPSYAQMQNANAAHVRRYTLPQHAFFIKTLSGQLKENTGEQYIATLIDPQASEVVFGQDDEKTVLQQFAANGIPCQKAKKSNQGLDRIEEMFRLKKLFLFKDETPNVQLEVKNYRWAEFTEATQLKRNKMESPLKKNDHAMNCLKFFGNFPVQRSYRPQMREISNLVRQELPDSERAKKDIAAVRKRARYLKKARTSRVFGTFDNRGLR